jgi:hypothetical protein
MELKKVQITVTTVVELTQTFYVNNEVYNKLKKYDLQELYEDEELGIEFYEILDDENDGGELISSKILDYDEMSINLITL